MSNFRPVDRETGFLLPPSVEEWLPERHLARFVVEVIEQLDLSAFVKAYRGSGSASYHPSMLLGLLVYGYATGVFSQVERATYDSVAFRFIAVNDHPDHDTIAAFRRRFLAIEGLFVEVLLLAREAGVLKLGTVALDGTKVAGPGPKDQVNLTDADSRIMPWPAAASNRHAVVQAPNDKRQNASRLLQRGQRERLRRGRDWKDRFAGAPPPPENPTPLEAMTHRLATPEGRQLYARNRCSACGNTPQRRSPVEGRQTR